MWALRGQPGKLKTKSKLAGSHFTDQSQLGQWHSRSGHMQVGKEANSSFVPLDRPAASTLWKLLLQRATILAHSLPLSYGHFDNDFLVNWLSRAPNRWHSSLIIIWRRKTKKLTIWKVLELSKWISRNYILLWKQWHSTIQIHNITTTAIALSFYGHFDNEFLVNRLSRAPNRWHKFVDTYLKKKRKINK
jgi:hypothetical protein